VLRLPLALFAVAATLLAPGLVGAGYDASIFTTIAVRLRAGDALYRDVWEHKPPGVFLADATVQALFPWLDAWTPIWILSVLCAAVLGFVVASVLRAHGYPRLAPWCGVAATATAAAFPISYGGGQSELIAAVPAAIAFALMARRPRMIVTFLAGTLLGLAFATSWHLAPALAVVGGIALYERDRIRRSSFLALGVASIGALIATWLVLIGAWRDAIDALIVFNAIYRDANLVDPIVKLSPSGGAAFLALAGALGVIGAFRRNARLPFVASAAWLALAVVMFVIEGRLAGHYLASVVVPLGILAAAGLRLVAPRPSTRIRGVAIVTGQLGLVLAFAVSAGLTIYWTRSLGDVYAQRATSLRDITSWLRTQTCTDTLFVWGHAPDIYYASGLRPASRYVSIPALMTEGWATPENVKGVVDELSRLRPTAVIDATSWGGAPVTFPLFGDEVLPTSGGRYVDALDPIRDFVRTHYSAVGDVGEWPAYALAGDCHP
jgi:hypothetical protein